MKKCPIQIITENRGGRRDLRWIALLKDINFKFNRYYNIIEYHPHLTTLDWMFFKRLADGNNGCEISNYDIIRNPTLDELMEISNAARSLGLRLNLKTGKITEVLEENMARRIKH